MSELRNRTVYFSADDGMLTMKIGDGLGDLRIGDVLHDRDHGMVELGTVVLTSKMTEDGTTFVFPGRCTPAGIEYLTRNQE